MESNKFFGKKSARYALAAATVALGLASVNTTAQASNPFLNTMRPEKVNLKVVNNTNGCVRAYVAGEHFDIAAHTSRSIIIPATTVKSYMASVYKYGCGGQALKNSWYTTNYNTLQTWNIY
jgi:hypothetical protein